MLTTCSTSGIEQPTSTSGIEQPTEMPKLHLYGIKPNIDMHCFNRTVAVSDSPEKVIPQEVLNDMQTIQNVRAITTVDSEKLKFFQNEETIANITKLKKMADCALMRLQETGNTQGTSSTPPDSPLLPQFSDDFDKSTENDSPAPSGKSRKYRATIRKTKEGVVHGTGVVANRSFKKHGLVSLYSGSLVYRRKVMQYNKWRQKFHVFKISTETGKPVPQFLNNDTFIAWSDLLIKHSGSPGIEVGLEATGPIKFLNHSKNANVKIISTMGGFPVEERLDFKNRSRLRLQVIAVKDIEPEEELLFDYDPDKPDSMIDFTLSDVEKPDKRTTNTITRAISKIYQKTNKG